MLAGSSAFGWFQPIAESNCLFLPRELYDELGGFDERFTQPGGGLLNLDFYRRCCELPDATLITLLGEASFHQFHGGIMANSPTEEMRRRFALYREEYQRIRGRPYQRPTRRSILFGDVSAEALSWVRASCEQFASFPESG